MQFHGPSDSDIEYLGLTFDEVLVSVDLVRYGVAMLNYGVRRPGIATTRNYTLL